MNRTDIGPVERDPSSRTDRYRRPIGSKDPGQNLTRYDRGGSKTDGPGGNGPIPTIQADGSNDPPAVHADPAPDPVTPISAHGRVKRPADGRVKKSRISIDPTAGRGPKHRRTPRRGLPPHLEAMMFWSFSCAASGTVERREGPDPFMGLPDRSGHTGEPIPAPDPISAERRSFT